MIVLHIDSSPQGPASVSRRLTQHAVDLLAAREPGVEVIRYDLGAEPIAHLTNQAVAAVVRSEVANDEQRAIGALSDRLVEDLLRADLIVLGSPMYNFGVSSQLKAWFDHVVRAGKTFRYTDRGPEGLVTGKRAIVVEARGGVYSSGPMAAFDHQEPYLKTLFGFIGVSDLRFIRAEGLAMGDDARAKAIARAYAEIDDLIGDCERLAA
jgi:FMN-dependent NADH-azoreductase